jgi:hypothetical protein
MKIIRRMKVRDTVSLKPEQNIDSFRARLRQLKTKMSVITDQTTSPQAPVVEQLAQAA